MGRHGETLEKTPEIMPLGNTGWHHEVWTKTKQTDKDMRQNKDYVQTQWPQVQVECGGKRTGERSRKTLKGGKITEREELKSDTQHTQG